MDRLNSRCISVSLKTLLLTTCSIWTGILNAEIVFDTQEIESKSTAGDQSLPFSFPFHVTEQTVSILRVKTSCGCTTVALPKQDYLPGEQGTIDVLFSIRGRRGPQRKVITVFTDDPQQPRIELVLKVQISNPVTISERFTYWLKSDAKPLPKAFDVKTNPDLKVHIVNVQSDNPAFHPEISFSEDPEKYKLTVVPEFGDGQIRYQKGKIQVNYRVGDDPKIHTETLLAYIK